MPDFSLLPFQADIWSFGVLVWEVISGDDITMYQPLALTMLEGSNAAAISLQEPDRSNERLDQHPDEHIQVRSA